MQQRIEQTVRAIKYKHIMLIYRGEIEELTGIKEAGYFCILKISNFYLELLERAARNKIQTHGTKTPL